jgi:N-acyl-L-homoserine lactone synthetase
MIEIVTIANMKRFPGNPLADQHRLRYRSIIERQKWNVPNYCQIEFDQYNKVRRTTGIHETIVN